MKKTYMFPEEKAGLKSLLIMCVFLGVIVMLISIVKFLGGPKSFDVAKDAYFKGDYERAHRIFKHLAEEGHAAAQYHLGLMYAEGQGVPLDDIPAAKWYRKAAEQEFPEAQHNLGYCYHIGLGVSQDYAEAAKWYGKAAGQGHADSQLNLGMMYGKGKGVPQDFLWAHVWMNIGISRYMASASVKDQSARDKIAIASQNINHIESMMTPAQIAEAERLARKWRPKKESEEANPY